MPIGHIMRHNTSEWRVSTLCCRPSKNTYLPDNQKCSPLQREHMNETAPDGSDSELLKNGDNVATIVRDWF
jgi:hypothetical protein